MTIQREHHADRVFGLDIFRALAIILVVMEHGINFLNDTVLNGFPFFPMIDGVDLFFVLSGFLIGSILLKEINLKDRFGIRKLVQFWKRRWFRTLPAYYLILLANYFIVHQGIINEDIHQFNWKFFFFLQNFSSPFAGFFWESWSLSVEEWFYISSPILLMLSLKFLTPKRSFILVTVLMIAFSFLYRFLAMSHSIDDFWHGQTYRKLVVMRLDSIAYGLLAAWIFYYFAAYWTRFKTISFIMGICLIVFVLNYKAPNSIFYKQVMYFTLSPIAAMLLLPFAQSIRTGNGIIAKMITHISKISYSMYLLNLALISEVLRDKFPPIHGNYGIIEYLVYWIIVIAGSTVLYQYFEKPIMNLRDQKISLRGLNA